ncbi:KilA-N domain-containing protein [Pontibacter sp. G13]|uniref:KilA-N domain-containing protein n=1 Tax=Pontibacter sp. G13 TaxID=3074898 RepID=UPI00288BDF52|nr:KilA-N domain-containing protein [Pontibacter sp. G13]WNJ21562.1 KilA-N domain-containing protein [Pontibacter sp. G13]
MAKRNEISVQGISINFKQVDGSDYISLTDMVKALPRPDQVIGNWMRGRNTLRFLAAWERLNNPNFNPLEFEGIMEHAGENAFTISPSEWITKTAAIGITTKRGRNGGTYAEKLIAFEFGSHISAEFKLLLISEFDRLKTEEIQRIKGQWDHRRFLSKVNYRLHTGVIRDVLIPAIQAPKNREWIIYADEADLLNLAVFGMTARQWRETNPDLAKQGNIRDNADILQLNVLANLESLNAFLIEDGKDKETRYQILTKAAVSQYNRLAQDEQLKKLDN